MLTITVMKFSTRVKEVTTVKFLVKAYASIEKDSTSVVKLKL